MNENKIKDIKKLILNNKNVLKELRHKK